MTEPRFFHPGEVKIQAESGSDTAHYEAAAAQMMTPDLKPNEVEFVSARTFSAAATIDEDTRPWASVLFATGDRPLFTVESPTDVRIAPPTAAGDPLVPNITARGALGVLYFDPSRRRRSKSIGRAEVDDDGSIRYRMTRNFGLCPKYIFKRTHQPSPESVASDVAGDGQRADRLTTQDREQLTATDTLFLASYHPGHGADATHRGGAPGFVTVVDDRTVEIPDYFGNGMFNTLGNLVLDPRLGMATVDFRTGRTIHLTGEAAVRANDDERVKAERIVSLHIDEVRISNASPGVWTDEEPSPYNPPVPA